MRTREDSLKLFLVLILAGFEHREISIFGYNSPFNDTNNRTSGISQIAIWLAQPEVHFLLNIFIRMSGFKAPG